MQAEMYGLGEPGALAGQAATAQPQQPVELPEVNLSPEGLDELMAPIALYPDPVLAVVLQAAANPQEVMDGGNWLAVDNHADLKEAALDQASSSAAFTPVMQALLHYPTVVDLMCMQFDWTKQLGAAYQANPKAVLASVQRLRAQVVDNGALKSSAQMKVEVKQDQGQQVVQLEPTNPKVIYVPQYNPDQVFSQTTTTYANGTTVTTTTGAPPPTSTTTVVQQQQGVSTGTAVAIGLLSFGAGVALGAAINNNNYYYPSWGRGGVWYGPRPYYPPPYHPAYYGAWHGGYNYNRPVHYGNNTIVINNNNNYYNRFNNNRNLNANYYPSTYSRNTNKANGVYSKSMGNRTEYKNNNVRYQPKNVTGNNLGSSAANNWKGQSTYQGRNAGNNVENRAVNVPQSGGANLKAGAANLPKAAGAANIPKAGNANLPNRGNQAAANTRADRGFGSAAQGRANDTRQIARNTNEVGQPRAAANANAAARPKTNNPAAQNRPQPTSGGALSGMNQAAADRSASARGRASMGAPPTRPASDGGNARAVAGGKKNK